MDNKKLAQACLDEFGEEHQRMLMVEEMSELTTVLCHYMKGRLVKDHVQEEIADCFAVLDQMDIIWGISKRKDVKNLNEMTRKELIKYVISIMGYIQAWEIEYSKKFYEKKSIKIMFTYLRCGLDALANHFGADEIEKWKVEKAERMVRRLKARGVEA